MNYGFCKSDMTDVISAKCGIAELPNKYEYKALPIIDQGNKGICVSVSMVEMLNSKKPLDYYYNKRKDKSIDGMTVKEAMQIAEKDGDISLYAKVQDPQTMKFSIFNNGPCAVALPVNNTNSEFWKGKPLLGGHCVVLIGWNDKGFILQNSWGTPNVIFPYSDWHYLYEAWTILK